MRLSLRAISDFKVIYYDRFKVALTDDEANQKGVELLELFQLIYRKVPVEDTQKLKLFDTEYRAS